MEDSKNLSLNFLNHEVENNSVTYVIKVSDGEDSWEIRVRYSNLRELHNKMKELNKEMPDFPAKKLWGNLNAKFISERQSKLAYYMSTVLKFPEKYKNSILYNFLLKGKKKTERKIVSPVRTVKTNDGKLTDKLTLQKGVSESQELYQEFKNKLMQIPKKNENMAWLEDEDKKSRH